MFKNDTIAAISTGMSNSGIGIVRITGEKALEVINKIFIPYNKNKDINNVSSHTVHYGNIVDGEKILDEVLVIIMKAPNTYTREDVVEIDCHGGVLVVKKIFELILKNEVRCAEPGEFTKRAFLNGRIDLSQAEAVADLINAKSSMALDASISQLKGKMSEIIKKEREKIIHHIAFIEAALDDPEHLSVDNYGQELKVDVKDILIVLEKLLNSFDDGKIISEGIKTVILGKPNAGKSSLMNTLLGEERAIVTDIAGTTRDTLEESVNLSELQLNIIDTAGIRETEDVVEKIGVERSKTMAKDCDLVIYVVDASVPLDDNDKEIIKIISDKKCIVLLNKTDLECIVKIEDIKKIIDTQPIEISAKNNIGIDKFIETVKDMFYNGKLSFNDEIYITNLRHKEALAEAIDSLKLVIKSIEDEMPEDFYSIDLMNSYEVLGRIIGESVEDDLVNEIFSKFCMGK
ncbi:MAG: tRNA uridine-5-carboxymethylaminomethyl(34) synthesis GTPase MnmE [Lachnospiraceae bacterium]|nr:tRNA uridine-5-carboxymethylaminomethyl(34) synthesis GTPase MnmE [Lachnospiraceae bacterium]